MSYCDFIFQHVGGLVLKARGTVHIFACDFANADRFKNFLRAVLAVRYSLHP